MKKILGFLAVAMLLGVIAPQTAYAEKKKDKEKKAKKHGKACTMVIIAKVARTTPNRVFTSGSDLVTIKPICSAVYCKIGPSIASLIKRYVFP